MKVKGKLVFKGEHAGEMVSIVAQSLTPDNPPEIKTTVDGNSAEVVFSADRIGTMLSSVDDYLMNAKIASDVIKESGRK